MPEKPLIEDAKIIAYLRENHHLSVTHLEFLPIGYDSEAGVYRVEADEGTYFLKVKTSQVEPLSLRLPHYLQQHGIPQVVAPLSRVDGELVGTVDHFSLILYPFIEGVSGWGEKLSDVQWVAFGAAMQKLHAMRLPDDLRDALPKETFIPPAKHTAIMRQLQTEIPHHEYDNPHQNELAVFWKTRQSELQEIIQLTDELGARLQAAPPDFVLCHADIHTGNLILRNDGAWFMVDWDQPILAPKERDLLFVMVGGFVAKQTSEDLFFRGYGVQAVDTLCLAYYRYERALEDLAEFAADVFLRDTSDDTKQDSLRWFKAQFHPDGLIAAAQKLGHLR